MINPSEIKAVIKNLPTKKSPDQMDLVQNSISSSEKNTNTLQIVLQNETEGTFPNSFYEPSITLIPKPHKDPTKEENYRPIFLINTDANIFNKNPCKAHPRIHQNSYLTWSSWVHPQRCREWSKAHWHFTEKIYFRCFHHTYKKATYGR